MQKNLPDSSRYAERYVTLTLRSSQSGWKIENFLKIWQKLKGHSMSMK